MSDTAASASSPPPPLDLDPWKVAVLVALMFAVLALGMVGQALRWGLPPLHSGL